MLQYLKNIIPRISEYSKTLDKLEVFVDKPWIFIDEKNNHHQYIFMRDLRLIMSLNGKTTIGKWELLPTKQLLINRVIDEILLQHLFVEDSILILKRFGTDDDPFILINQDKIPNLDVVDYLEEYEQTKITNTNNFYVLLSNGKIAGPEFYEGKKIITQNNLILNGLYQTNNLSYNQYVIIKNNVISKLYYSVKYYHNNNEITICQKLSSILQNGDLVNFKEKIEGVSSNYIEVKNLSGEFTRIKLNHNFIIIDVKDDELTTYSIIVFGIVCILFFIFILYVSQRL